jgi:hypothetical protein
MAGLRAQAASGEVGNLVAATDLFVMCFTAPAGRRVRIERIAVTMRSTVANDPPSTLRVASFTYTSGGAAITLGKKCSTDAETLQSVALSGSSTITGTVGANITEQDYIYNNQTKVFTFGAGRELFVPAGGTIVVLVKGGASVGYVLTKAHAHIDFEE